MGKHRQQQKHRRMVVAAVAVGAIGIPSVALACVNWPGGEERERGHGTVAARGTDRDTRHEPDWYRRWTSSPHGEPSAAPSDTPTATASPSKPGAAKPGGVDRSHRPRPKATAPVTPSAEPTTAAAKPTTASPQPTEASSKPTTAPPKPTVAAPRPTASAPRPTPSHTAPSSPASTDGAQVSGAVARVVELVNDERARAGCAPVTVNTALTEAAQRHSEDMAATGTMSHSGSGGSSPGDRITSAGYSWSTYGENVAYGYSTPEQVMQGWMTSPGHRANILNCAFEEIGVGLAQPGHYWTQDFGTAR